MRRELETAQAGGWNPYHGAGSLILAVILFMVALALVYFGSKLAKPLRFPKLSQSSKLAVVLVFFSSLVFLLMVYSFLRHLSSNAARAPSPIFPITAFCAFCTFFIILWTQRAWGVKLSLLRALIGTAVAPMIFEFPFDLIVIGRVEAPVYFALIFFIPLFLVEITTFLLLFLVPGAGFTKNSLFCLAGIFAVFGIWAVFGFSYPSNPLSFLLNSISKVLSFATAIALFGKGRND